MLKLICCLGIVMVAGVASAQERIELGLGAGQSTALWGDTFRTTASKGDAQSFWLGYAFEKDWAVEFGLDNVDFDAVNTKHQAIHLSGVYRFAEENWIHPIAKFGVTSVDSKDAADLKTSAFGAKAAVGLEADFKYVSLGALFNYFYTSKTDSLRDYKDTQFLVPAVFIAFHTVIDGDNAPVAKAPVATAVPEKKDADRDGVADDDDKCPGTAAGLVVNAIGCAEQEKASIQLNVEFRSGQAVLEEKAQSEITKLAEFMKKFAASKVEIAGYTDNTGSAAANTALSQKRADVVRAALIQSGVEASRVTAKGYGPSMPVADNKTEAGRKQNRRVMAEISVVADRKK